MISGGGPDDLPLDFAAEVFTALAIERAWLDRDVDALVSKLSVLGGIEKDRVIVHLVVNALRSLQLLEIPPGIALETQLSILMSLTPMIVEAGLWTRDSDGRPSCFASFGKTTKTRRSRLVASRVLEARPAEGGEGGTIRGVPVRRWQSGWAALVVRMRSRESAAFFLEEAAAAMSPIIEREFLLRRSASREHSLVRASERRLSRLGFDLHDGALQHLSALRIDLKLLRDQVRAGTESEIVCSRTDDLDSRIIELDRVLRELAHSLEPESLVRRPLVQVLESEVRAFEERGDVETSLAVSGRFETLTPSQKIAVVRVVQEALTNIREHSNAKRVEIRITESRGHLQAWVRDDGDGFQVSQTLLSAARRGRLGLVGSSERVRLLGGTFDVQSKPGGPTTVSMSLPHWQPLEAESPAAAPALAAV
jgi:signal transduction histidine kinase